MPPGVALVLGLDIGATTSRAVLADQHGQQLGAGLAGGGSPIAHSPQQAVDSIVRAVSAALDGRDPQAVRMVVLGLAGGNRLLSDTVHQTFERTWHAVGLRCPVRTVGDTEAAFAAGTAEPSGTVLIAGTGAAAVEIDSRTQGRVADGAGWLLGDLGSAMWLGKKAVQAALAELNLRRPASLLTSLVLEHLLDHRVSQDQRVNAVITAVYEAPPVQLAQLAPLVTMAAAEGDPVAGEITAAAVNHLVNAVAAVRTAGASTPIVATGGVLTAPTLLAESVLDTVRQRWKVPVVITENGVLGAVWLAVRQLPGLDERTAASVHLRLTTASRPPIVHNGL